MNSSTYAFQDQTVFISGASRGIGAATARLFGASGARVVVNYREDRDSAESVAHDIQSGGGQALVLQGDVGSVADVQRMLEGVTAAWGPVTVLVHNASAPDRSGFLDATLDQFDLTYAANVRGPFAMSQVVARNMIAAGVAGCIIHISSILARQTIPNRTLYASSKGAIESLTRAMALDLAPHGIRVNAIAPGLIYTNALKAGMAALGEDNFVRYIPLKRFGDPDEIARVVAFLASESASYITGTLINVDGGLGVLEAGPR
ncbi:MAG: SDR family oxidoreductase [Anaerolineales bacterium]|nr:SDR family oxidoreductase [Anaerolineales bacterium]